MGFTDTIDMGALSPVAGRSLASVADPTVGPVVLGYPLLPYENGDPGPLWVCRMTRPALRHPGLRASRFESRRDTRRHERF